MSDLTDQEKKVLYRLYILGHRTFKFGLCWSINDELGYRDFLKINNLVFRGYLDADAWTFHITDKFLEEMNEGQRI